MHVYDSQAIDLCSNCSLAHLLLDVKLLLYELIGEQVSK